MRLSLRNPVLITLSLLISALFSTFLPVLPGQYIFSTMIIISVSLFYYSLAMAWLWSALNVASPAGSLRVADAAAFVAPPVAFSLQKFLQRYENMSILLNGEYSYVPKMITAVGVILLLMCALKVVIAVESRLGSGKISLGSLCMSAVSVVFLPVGVWLIWPKLKKIDAMRVD
ncbi:hypothetical protein [Caulobacter segnis]|uniref:hypothetical protein n=1 Tax=Caulobacter segnis TaxID=88688 RepID=UPI0028642210|nr:hypothetical protein [Caulobacter segnis]MDR6624319.1 hypothetical protein [Caulobacter segnis]